jgi:hypothetical protein
MDMLDGEIDDAVAVLDGAEIKRLCAHSCHVQWQRYNWPYRSIALRLSARLPVRREDY